MIGLNGSLSIAAEALAAQGGALGVTNNNIANVNTPGYSRQIVKLTPDVVSTTGGSDDNGVSYNGFSSVRDELLQLGVHAKTSSAASLQTQSTAWSQVEAGFSSTISGVGAAMSSLFSNLSGLSTQPSDPNSRQAVLASAASLVNAFHQASGTLSTARGNADSQVTSTVAQINGFTKQIAGLNSQISALQNNGQDGGALQDQRDQLTLQLAQLTSVSTVQTESAPTLTTALGSALVVGDASYPLQIVHGSDGLAHIFDAQGQDITTKLSGGSLGGAITMRDTALAQVSSQLDSLASEFAASMNAAQAQGYDASGAAGQAMFAIPTNGSSAAAGIALNLSSGSSLALSSDGSAGSSGNLSNLLGVQTTALPSGQTPSDTYGSLVLHIGTASSGVSVSLTATNASLQQLTNQQASTSGVSIDEETTNLLRYQQAYTAAAKVISTLNELYSAVLNMGTN